MEEIFSVQQEEYGEILINIFIAVNLELNMGRIAHERKIHITYFGDLVAHYNEQSTELKRFCAEVGRPYGYSSMNVFFFFFFNYWLHKESGVPRLPYLSEL